MVLLVSDNYGKNLRLKLNEESPDQASFEQSLEYAYRGKDIVLAISLSGNSFQIAANKYYEDFPAISIRSTEDIDDALTLGVRLFEIHAGIREELAEDLFDYLGKRK